MKGENSPQELQRDKRRAEAAWQGWIRKLLNVNMMKMSLFSIPPPLEGCEGLTQSNSKKGYRNEAGAGKCGQFGVQKLRMSCSAKKRSQSKSPVGNREFQLIKSSTHGGQTQSGRKQVVLGHGDHFPGDFGDETACRSLLRCPAPRVELVVFVEIIMDGLGEWADVSAGAPKTISIFTPARATGSAFCPGKEEKKQKITCI